MVFFKVALMRKNTAVSPPLSLIPTSHPLKYHTRIMSPKTKCITQCNIYFSMLGLIKC